MIAPPDTTPVRAAHRFDEAALARYLAAHLEAVRAPLEVRQFAGGQSNPTFHVRAGDRAYVLRKKPPGTLLPSAHAVHREFRIISALHPTLVPVARPLLYCDDAAIIGTPFYVMEHVDGRVFRDVRLPGLEPAERAAVYDAMNEVLATLHEIDHRQIGLADYGRPGNYYARQIARWTQQYEAAKTGDIDAMTELIAWLPANIPAGDETTIVHGDYRLENLIFHPTEPRILAVIDWELSTLGHPLGDLAYNCMPYHVTASSGLGGLVDRDPASGIPSEAEYVAAYCRRTRRAAIERWSFYLAFSMFRLASIAQGVYARGLQGNASSENAMRHGEYARTIAARAWEIARKAEG